MIRSLIMPQISMTKKLINEQKKELKELKHGCKTIE